MPTEARRRQEEFYGSEIAISLHEWFPPKLSLQDRWMIPKDETTCAVIDFALEEDQSATVLAAITVEQRFLELADRWDRETAHLSSTPKMILHDSYQKIMAMGPDVVPFLLRDLQRNRRSWFWALRHITDANPVPVQDQGNVDKMIAAWVAWGKSEGRI